MASVGVTPTTDAAGKQGLPSPAVKKQSSKKRDGGDKKYEAPSKEPGSKAEGGSKESPKSGKDATPSLPIVVKPPGALAASVASSGAQAELATPKAIATEDTQAQAHTFTPPKPSSPDKPVEKLTESPAPVVESGMTTPISITPPAQVTGAEDPVPVAKNWAKLLGISELAEIIMHPNPDPSKLNGAILELRLRLSRENDVPIQQSLDTGMLPHIIKHTLEIESNPLRFELLWILTNICAGNNTQTDACVQCGGLEAILQILHSHYALHARICDQCVWCLGNIAGDGPQYRDMLLAKNTMTLLQQICASLPDLEWDNQKKLETLRNLLWAMGNLCRGSPKPPLQQVVSAFNVFSEVICRDMDDECTTESLWGLLHLVQADSSGSTDVSNATALEDRMVNLCCTLFLKVGQPDSNNTSANDIATMDLTLFTDRANPLIIVLLNFMLKSTHLRWVVLKILGALVQSSDHNITEVCLRSGIMRPLLAFLKIPEGQDFLNLQEKLNITTAPDGKAGDHGNTGTLTGKKSGDTADTKPVNTRTSVGQYSIQGNQVVYHEIDGYPISMADWSEKRVIQHKREVCFILSNIAAGNISQLLEFGNVYISDPRASEDNRIRYAQENTPGADFDELARGPMATYDGFSVLRDVILKSTDFGCKRECCYALNHALAAKNLALVKLLVQQKDLFKCLSEILGQWARQDAALLRYILDNINFILEAIYNRRFETVASASLDEDFKGKGGGDGVVKKEKGKVSAAMFQKFEESGMQLYLETLANNTDSASEVISEKAFTVCQMIEVLQAYLDQDFDVNQQQN